MQIHSLLSGLAAAAGTLLLAACAGGGSATVDAPSALDFTLTGSDGQVHTLDALTADGPVLLYFIKDGCPTNDQALPHYAALAKGYGDGVRLVGVLNRSGEAAEKWLEKWQPPYLVLLDPDKEVINAYGAKRSPWVVEMARGGERAQTWEGYSAIALEQQSAVLATAQGRTAVPVDAAALPAKMRYG